MAVIAINKILDQVRAKYLPGAKVPSVMIAAEMQMFPINQVITQGWPLLQAILKPGLEVNTHIWAQVPKSILKGKGVDPLEQGGAMEAGGSKVEGKQASDGNQGGKGGEKGKKKEKKERKEKKIERVAKGSDGAKQPQERLRAPVQALEPPKAPSPGPSKGPTRPSAWATSKPPVTPSKWAPSLGPGPSPSKKAKASVSRLRLKTPSLTQKAKFGPPPRSIPQASALELIATPVNALLDPGPGPSLDPTDQIIKGLEVCIANLEKQVERIPDLELQLSSMARVIEALWEQVQGQLATHSFPTSSHRSLPLPPSVSRQMQRLQLEMANFHPKSHFLTLEAEGQPSSQLGLWLVGTSADGGKSAPSPLHLHIHQQPHPGVEMEDDASGEGSGDDAGPPLPIPPPFTDLVPPIETLSSEPDMELEDVDMEKE
ncbi:hypothetical protein PAXRUDRAFT_20609 [Paxillus rubicundulus Ve08.2h10]|uniref:Uncharacterized protein n=1 Tax=Paxillus rubicundulus Ve08.2h10 TaxID=930991 RepID=A0A0D0D1D1_9AGAM|nr:hypothetical protein PAXRUDRAFT_20609 [Paxillus rubicundulus Ve08.2h10]